MSNGMAKGIINKPKGLGTDNMSCIIVKFLDGCADGANPHDNDINEEAKEEDWDDIYEKENWPPLPEPEGTPEE